MRKSNLILLIAIGVFFGVFLSVTFMARAGIKDRLNEDGSLVSNPADSTSAENGQEPIILDNKDFDNINIIGNWTVSVESGDDYMVIIDYQGKSEDDCRIEQDGNTLVLFDTFPARAASVIIVMPELISLTGNGKSAVTLAGFEGDSLDLSLKGDTQLTGQSGSYQLLNLVAEGDSAVNLTSMPVTDANIEMSGKSVLTMTILGGELNGKCSGKSDLTYFGIVSSENVNLSGQAVINRP